VAQWVAGLIIPALLSFAYAGLILTHWAEAPGGFDTLENVMILFTVPGMALAGWLHFLAFDLCLGAWEVRVAQREGIAHLLVLPCLMMTFLLGPIGFAMFLMLRVALGFAGRGVRHV
jgi:hypothetical protein